MKVFVAGGNGFIGSVFVRRLHAAGYEIRCLLRPHARTARIDDLPLEHCRGDVRDVDSLRRGMTGCSAAVNLAYSAHWALLNSPEQEDTAIKGTRNILVAARQAGIERVVQVSSIAAIGATRRPHVMDETTVFDLMRYRRLRYAHYKHRGEQICRQAVAEGLDVVVVNPAEVYGPNDTDLVTAGNIVELVSQNPVVVTRGGTCIAHVDDVAAGIQLALERGRSGERYILGGENISSRQMAALCHEILGTRRRILTVPSVVLEATVRITAILRRPPPCEPDLVPYASRYWYMSGQKASRELGASFRPARPTLLACLDWLRDDGRIHVSTAAVIRPVAWILAFGAWSLVGCASRGTATQSRVAVQSNPPACDLAAASPWIERWFDAWELASREIIRLSDAPPPNVVFYDDTCVYTTLEAALPGVSPVDGPALRGAKLLWRTAAHNDSLTLPGGTRVPVSLMTFANVDRDTGPYFVMAAPSYWVAQMGRGDETGFTGVFLHEFAHTRQIRGVAAVIGPIDSTWAYPEELNDDAVQTHFGSDSVYVAAYIAERDLLYRAAAADSLAETRALAGQALAMMRSRHARWFTGDKAVFATLDDIFLSLEGAAQWTAYAWLAHPEGGGMERDAAVKKMLGRRRWWAQDQGLALFLVVDLLLPEWPSLVFSNRSPGATELLELATKP